jgi:hypothetical protein
MVELMLAAIFIWLMVIVHDLGEIRQILKAQGKIVKTVKEFHHAQ